MATVYPLTFGGGLPFFGQNSFDPNSQGLDSADVKIAWVWQPPAGLTLTQLAVYVPSGLVTGTSPTYRLSLQGVNPANGEPTGTELGGGSPAGGSAQLVDDQWNWIALDNSYAPDGGELLAMVLEHDSGTIDGSNFAEVYHSLNLSSGFNLPYVLVDTGGGWGMQRHWPIFGFGEVTNKYGWMHVSKLDMTTTTAGDRIAMQFNLPASRFGTTYKVAGFRVSATPTTSDDIVYSIWNAAGTVLQTQTIPGGLTGIGGDQGGHFPLWLYFDTPVNLNYGTDYYIGFEQDDTETLSMPAITSISNEIGILPWGAYASGQEDTGSGWTNTDRLPFIDLILDDSAPTSGSGSAGRLIGPSVLIG